MFEDMVRQWMHMTGAASCRGLTHPAPLNPQPHGPTCTPPAASHARCTAVSVGMAPDASVSEKSNTTAPLGSVRTSALRERGVIQDSGQACEASWENQVACRVGTGLPWHAQR